jgi:hypothetical protein
MDEVTQQNAALVEEAAAAAESLEEQANKLVNAVAVFKFSRSSGPGFVQAKPVVERRSPDRANNVARILGKPRSQSRNEPSAEAVAAPSRKVVGADDEWTEF